MVDKENIYAVSIYCGQNRTADFLYVGQQKSFAIMSVDGMHTLLVLVIYSVNIGM